MEGYSKIKKKDNVYWSNAESIKLNLSQLNPSCIILTNEQTCFKNLAVFTPHVYLTIYQRYTWKSSDEKILKMMTGQPCFCLNPSIEIIEAINPLTTSVFHYVGTSQLICSANQLTGF